MASSLSAYTVMTRDQAGDVWLINNLLGRTFHLEGELWDALAQDVKSNPEVIHLAKTLLEEGFLDQGEGLEEEIYRSYVADAANNSTYCFGFLLDQLTREEIEKTASFACQYLGQADKLHDKMFIHAWLTTPEANSRLGAMVEAVNSFPTPREGKYFSFRTNGLLIPTDEDLACYEALGAQRGTLSIVFDLSQEAVMQAGGADAYCSGLVEQQALYHSVGFIPQYLFRLQAETVDFMIEEFYKTLCFSGIYPRDLNVVYSKGSCSSQLSTCELYRPDFSTYCAKAKYIAASPTHQIINPLSKGMPDKLRALLRDGKEMPDAVHCPFSYNSVIFGHAGYITSCPVVQERIIKEGIDHYKNLVWGELSTGEIDSRRLISWSRRNPFSVPACSKCSVSPFCASGCHLTAYEMNNYNLLSPSCPPIDDILQIEISIAKERCNDNRYSSS